MHDTITTYIPCNSPQILQNKGTESHQNLAVLLKRRHSVRQLLLPPSSLNVIVAEIDDLFEVKDKVTNAAGRWRHIGLALGIRDPLLEEIEAQKSTIEECLTAMLRLWLKQSYDTEEYGKPSWQSLSDAVKHRSGGRNNALADEISGNTCDFEPMDTQ